MKETKMDKLTTEFAEHICDNLCHYPHLLDKEELEDKCLGCKIGKFICDILNEHNRILEQVQQYKELGTLEELQELKERDTAKKPIKTKGLKDFHGNIYKVVGKCLNCGCGVSNRMRFCDECGQKLDWED